MLIAAIVLALCSVLLAFAYAGAPLWAHSSTVAAWLLLSWAAGVLPGPVAIVLWAALLVVTATLHLAPVRRALLSAPARDVFRRVLPPMSETEREAIEAGTVWWDAELFSGSPDWRRLLEVPPPRLSEAEQAFLDGPVETLCAMIDDWRITHELEALPDDVWAYLKSERFFGMIVPQRYGGLGFSALAHSAVVMKVASRSISAGVTVMVPNSLGPAELLLHYGTDAQREHYLPRLARGEEVPCFALTGPEAGSDASAIPDVGVVCRGAFGGEADVLGIRLRWDKRYITLGPVATLLGLAFKLEDPDRLLGDNPAPGISLALVPTDLPGVEIGNRHRPMYQAFANGPTRGRDVFLPVDCLIGGPALAGQGWRMLMESLAAGRSISLPALATGSGKLASRATGAYAAIRRQFRTPVGQFEGVQEALARIGGNAYLMDAARTLTASAIDLGERPSVVSAIVKYHLTERMRQVLNDAMDVHGGRGICMGPRNYLARGYVGVPIGITVEGANILTRSLIIFGQGAIRCHPFLLREMAAARDDEPERGIADFDAAFFAHVRHGVRNAARAFVLGLCGARIARSPVRGSVGYYYRQLARMSAALAISADITLALFGGRLKRLERLSARLGDVLSHLYLASAALKRFEDDGRPAADRPLLHWACRDALHRMQGALDELYGNLPIRWAGRVLRLIVFPLGRPFAAPSDANDRRVARLLLTPSAARDRLTEGVYLGTAGEPVGRVEDALSKAAAAEPATRRLQRALKGGAIAASDPDGQIAEAEAAGILTAAETLLLAAAEAARREAISVDEFAPGSFGRATPGPGTT